MTKQEAQNHVRHTQPTPGDSKRDFGPSGGREIVFFLPHAAGLPVCQQTGAELRRRSDYTGASAVRTEEGDGGGIAVKPYFDDGSVTIYHGDCREILPSLGKFDLLLTDPPYGLGDLWQGGTWGANSMYADARKWDVKPENEVIEQLVSRFPTAMIWGGNYFRLPPTRGFLAWIKNPQMQTMADLEYCWTSFDKPAKSITTTRNPDGKREHPTQKPLEVIKWCIDQAGSAKTILDPFAGSGTTGRAAKDMGRKCVLIEREERIS